MRSRATYLFGLLEGDPTTFKGPVGSFTLHENQRDVLFVAMGTGIAPIPSMLWSLAVRASTRRIALFWGLRSERDLSYQDELTTLGQQLPNLSATITLLQPTGGWNGPVRRVSPLITDAATTASNLVEANGYRRVHTLSRTTFTLPPDELGADVTRECHPKSYSCALARIELSNPATAPMAEGFLSLETAG